MPVESEMTMKVTFYVLSFKDLLISAMFRKTIILALLKCIHIITFSLSFLQFWIGKTEYKFLNTWHGHGGILNTPLPLHGVVFLSSDILCLWVFLSALSNHVFAYFPLYSSFFQLALDHIHHLLFQTGLIHMEQFRICFSVEHSKKNKWNKIPSPCDVKRMFDRLKPNAVLAKTKDDFWHSPHCIWSILASSLWPRFRFLCLTPQNNKVCIISI